MAANSNFLIRIYSFSYKKGVPCDPGGNGGGFVFDCRGLPNPGRNSECAELTGLDADVIKMLIASSNVNNFLDSAIKLVRFTASDYLQQGFRDLMVSFGCTGGRHRSVFCAETVYRKLKSEGFNVRVIHWEMEKFDARFMRKRAMIFAAGEGTRLQPLTLTTPKALVEAGGKTMLERTVEALIKAGFNEIAVNVFHLKEKLTEYIKGMESRYPECKFIISDEEKLLGTGGGLRQAGRYVHGPAPILVHNVDIWTEYDLEELYRQHNPADLATVITQKRESSRYLLVDGDDRIVGRFREGEELYVTRPQGEVRKLAFSGIHIISPQFLEKMSVLVYNDIIDCYMELTLQGNIVRSKRTSGSWFDMGTEEKLGKLRERLEKKENL